jgi:hypothetical protein
VKIKTTVSEIGRLYYEGEREEEEEEEEREG